MSVEKLKVGINGFGRIGRNVFKQGFACWDIVAVNDVVDDVEILAHLLKYDSLSGKYSKSISTVDDGIYVDDKFIKFSHFKRASDIKWTDQDVDLVIDATGKYLNNNSAEDHIGGSVKRVVLTGATQDCKSIFLGISDLTKIDISQPLYSIGTCTANALMPILYYLDEVYHILNGRLSTVHCSTSNQSFGDAPHSDFRRSRMASRNIIPTETTAMDPIFDIMPHLENHFTGMAIRVPIAEVSMIEVNINVRRKTCTRDVQTLFKSKISTNPYIDYTNESLVSSDFTHSHYSSIIDGDLIQVTDGEFIRVVSWYDNEWGFSSRVKDLVSILQSLIDYDQTLTSQTSKSPAKLT